MKSKAHSEILPNSCALCLWGATHTLQKVWVYPVRTYELLFKVSFCILVALRLVSVKWWIIAIALEIYDLGSTLSS